MSLLLRYLNRIALNRHFCTKQMSSPPSPPKRVFSGIQPTGPLHLGNYFGAVKRWVNLQNQLYDEIDGNDNGDRRLRCIYSIVDLHSITIPESNSKSQLELNIKTMIASLLGCGINPQKCVLFQQSHVPHHSQLSWIFSCIATMAQLNRFPQFKEKTENLKDIPVGLFLYPVLQTADILLYKANCVPIGDDQIPHLQLAHLLSTKFNGMFNCNVFPYPVASLDDYLFTSRLKSLRNPSKKMSKSEPDSRGRIEITDTADDIREKCKKAVTDCTSRLTFEPDTRPGISNLILIHSLFTGLTPQQICDNYCSIESGEYKMILADIIIEKLKPIRDETIRLMNEDHYLYEILTDGAQRAQQIAECTMSEVYDAIGMNAVNVSLKNKLKTF